MRLPAGGRLDFGAVGKGYALDAAAGVLRRRGVRRALLNFGGQLLALDPPPGRDGWPVQAPGGALSLSRASLAVSGQSERPGHIRDPRSGAVAAGPESVAVLLPRAAEADAWSTALFVLGPAAVPSSFPGCALFQDAAGARRAGDCSPFRFEDRTEQRRPS